MTRCNHIPALLAAALCTLAPASVPALALRAPAARPDAPKDEAYEIALEAYAYLYPLITMDLTRLQFTNIEAGKEIGKGPMNAFVHVREYPDASFRGVVRPNFDTLYSCAWLDLTSEPLIVSAPNTDGRYYMLPMLDMWSDVFAVPGSRTSGDKAGNFAVVAPGWQGKLPDGVEKIEATTPYVWIIGRTQTNGPADYAAVHKIQDGYRLTPLSQWGKTPAPVVAKIVAGVDMKTPPKTQVDTMPGTKFFAYGAELMKTHKPHATDWSLVARMKRIGLVPGQSFDVEKLTPEVRSALDRAAADGLKGMLAKIPTLARVSNGWSMNTDTMGVYGNYYLKRAIVAMLGLGANQCEDAIYPMNIVDADGKPMAGESKYVMHFEKGKTPPAEAFWSITMYDAEGFQTPNPINRFAIGDRDNLKFNADGSLDIYIQHDSPGKDKEGNWLPSPAKGTLGVTMRLYAPKAEVVNGYWAPPVVKKVN